MRRGRRCSSVGAAVGRCAARAPIPPCARYLRPVTADAFSLLDATSQAALVRDGDVKPRELVEAAVARVEAVNPTVNAVIHERFERALDEATEPADGPFRGVPIVVKDHDG